MTSSASSLFREASALYSGGKVDAAEATLARALAANPDHVKSLILKGVIHNARQRYDKAIEKFDHALRIEPSNALAFGNRGIAQRNKGQTRAAVADLSRALQLLGGADVSFLKQRAIAYRVLEMYPEALDDYNSAIAAAPDGKTSPHALAEMLYQRSRVYMRLDEHVNRLADLADALKLDPDNKAYRTAFVEASAALSDEPTIGSLDATTLVGISQPLLSSGGFKTTPVTLTQPKASESESELKRSVTTFQLPRAQQQQQKHQQQQPQQQKKIKSPQVQQKTPIVYSKSVLEDSDSSEERTAAERPARPSSKPATGHVMQLHTSTQDSDSEPERLTPRLREASNSPYAHLPYDSHASSTSSVEYADIALPNVPRGASPLGAGSGQPAGKLVTVNAESFGQADYDAIQQQQPQQQQQQPQQPLRQLSTLLVDISVDSSATCQDEYALVRATPSTREKVAAQQQQQQQQQQRAALVNVAPAAPISDDEYAALIAK
jgi:tetratricopeptide (TPR) repeat protein